MRRWSFLFLLTLLAYFANAQPVTVYNYTVTEGLPSAEVYEVFEDKKGFIWFATDHGVVKFDGQEMKTFHLTDGLTDPVVFGFQEDERGRIWFRTFSGKLCYYENDKIIPYKYNDILLKAASLGLIAFVYLAHSDELWFSVRNQLGKIDGNGGLTEISLDHPEERESIIYKAIKNQGLIITAQRTMDLKWIFINDKKFPITVSNQSYINKVFCKITWRDKLYLSAYNDVFEYDGVRVRKVITGKDPIISLSSDKEGNLWVGYLNGGVHRFSTLDFKDPWAPEFLTSKSVTKVHQDQNGALWFSTLESGVYLVPNISIEGFSLPANGIIKSVNASDTYILVNEKSGMVRFYDKKSKKISHEKKFNYNVLSVFSDDRKNFWISGHDAISLYDSSFNLIKTFPDNNAIDFFQNGDRTVWGIGSQRLYQFDENFSIITQKIFYDVYRTLNIHNSLFFLGRRIGLHIRDSTFKESKILKAFENYKISDVSSLNDSTVLISTIGNGFIILNTNTWETDNFDATHKFIANNIYATLRRDSLLWIGTEKGLAVIPLRSLLGDDPTFNYLNKISGLRSNTINFLAAGDRSIWAFSDDGFSVIPDTLTRFATKTPSFYIKTITCNEVALDPGKKIILNASQNNIKVSFGFISFNTQNIFLRYKVSEDEPWTYTQDKLLHLTSLAPGVYSCKLEYSADNIHWVEAFLPIDFTINPPWYQQWYIYPAGLMILFIVGYLYFRHQQSIYKQRNHYLKIINEHQQKLIQSEVVTVERERNRIAKELHDGIGTNLTAIKLRVSQLLQQQSEPLANDIEDQFQTTINEIKNIIYGLTPPSLERYGLFTALKNYVNKISKNLPLTITLKIFGHDVNNYELNIIIFRVIQELLSNSVKHSYAKNILIHLSSFDDLMSIIYEDDGVGFQYDPVQNGLGLDSIESRIQSIHGVLKFDSGNFGISYNIEIPLKIKNVV